MQSLGVWISSGALSADGSSVTLGHCYYGLQLQSLIMHQWPDLFKSTAGVRPQTKVVVVDDEDGNMACDNHYNGEQEQWRHKPEPEADVVVVGQEVDKVGMLKMTSFEESDFMNPDHCVSELNVAGANKSNDSFPIERGDIVALTAVVIWRNSRAPDLAWG